MRSLNSPEDKMDGFLYAFLRCDPSLLNGRLSKSLTNFSFLLLSAAAFYNNSSCLVYRHIWRSCSSVPNPSLFNYRFPIYCLISCIVLLDDIGSDLKSFVTSWPESICPVLFSDTFEYVLAVFLNLFFSCVVPGRISLT